MKFYCLLFFGLTLLTACNDSEKKIAENKDSTAIEITVKKDSLVQEKEFSVDTILHADLENNNVVELKGYLQPNGPKVSCHFIISKPSGLTATVTPVKEGCNIRFTNIIMPNNKTDGPFGKELSYSLSKKGEYQLIIGHNMMSGDPEACDFVLKLQLN